MNIIWFSEIRWDYLFTRKQHILSLFPKKDNILFVQPFNFLKKESIRSVPENIYQSLEEAILYQSDFQIIIFSGFSYIIFCGYIRDY